MTGDTSSGGSEREPCPTCGVKDFVGEGSLIPVWQDPTDYEDGEPPDYIGCTECETMEPCNTDSER